MKIYNEVRAEEFLSRYFKIDTEKLTRNINECIEFVKKYKYPVVLKIISDQALHKSKINGVRIINNEQELKSNYEDLLKISKKLKLKLDGILIQAFITGKEIIIGGKRDNTFGPIILFGSGGVFTEVLKDFSIRICPADEKDVNEMVKESKLYATLNEKDLKKITSALLKINEIMLKHSEIVELDINPFILNEKDFVVVDARMIVN